MLLAFSLEPKELFVAALHIGGNVWQVELRHLMAVWSCIKTLNIENYIVR